jgi:hypothetical protein
MVSTKFFLDMEQEILLCLAHRAKHGFLVSKRRKRKVKRQRELELLTCSPELSIGIPYAE